MLKKTFSQIIVFSLILGSLGLADTTDTYIIYSRSYSSNWGFGGGIGGGYFELNNKGEIIYYNTIMGNNTIINEKHYVVDKKYVDKIEALIDNTDISDIPDYINNNSLDGAFIKYTFKGKLISGDNLSYYSPDLFESIKDKEYLKIMHFENRAIALSNAIEEILRSSGIELYDESNKENTDTVIFEYSTKPAHEKDYTTLVSLKLNGDIIYTSQGKTHTTSTSPEYAQEVLALIKQQNLYLLPNYINNATMDGTSHKFLFNDIVISCDNIYYTDEGKLKNFTGDDLEFMQQQNQVLDLFQGIQNIFARAHFNLSLNAFSPEN